MNHAQRPVFLIGGGVNISHANKEMLKLAEITGVPVITTIMGKGAIPTTHDLYVGNIGIHGSYAANTAISHSWFCPTSVVMIAFSKVWLIDCIIFSGVMPSFFIVIGYCFFHTCMRYRKSCIANCNTPTECCPEYTPDFIKLAESYGAKGIRVTDEKEMIQALEAAKNNVAISCMFICIPPSPEITTTYADCSTRKCLK